MGSNVTRSPYDSEDGDKMLEIGVDVDAKGVIRSTDEGESISLAG